MPPETRYDFRAVTEADLPMLAAWLAQPHVAEWWDDDSPEASLAEIVEAMDSVETEPLIVELGGRPIDLAVASDEGLLAAEAAVARHAGSLQGEAA